jgi:hypothetical protein
MFSYYWHGAIGIACSKVDKKVQDDFVNFSSKPLSFDQCTVATEMVVQLMRTSQPLSEVPLFIKRFVPGMVLSVTEFQSEVFLRRHELLAVSEEHFLYNGEHPFLDVFRWAVRGPLMAACKSLWAVGSEVEHAGELMVSELYSIAYGIPDQLFSYLTQARKKVKRSTFAFREKPSKSYPDNKVRQIVPLVNGVGVEMRLVGVLKQLSVPVPGSIVVQKNGQWLLYVPPAASDDDIMIVVDHYHNYMSKETRYVTDLRSSRMK